MLEVVQTQAVFVHGCINTNQLAELTGSVLDVSSASNLVSVVPGEARLEIPAGLGRRECSQIRRSQQS